MRADSIICATQCGMASISLDFANQAVKNNPSNADAYFIQVRAPIARREISQAEPILERLRKTSPQSAAVHSKLGIVIAMKKGYAGGGRLFEPSLTLDPGSMRPPVTSAWTFGGQKGRGAHAHSEPCPARQTTPLCSCSLVAATQP